MTWAHIMLLIVRECLSDIQVSCRHALDAFLKVAKDCRGNGIAKKCEAAGGDKTNFALYIANLWSKIGYTPGAVDKDMDGSLVEEIEQQVGGQFTPMKTVSSPEKYTGVAIKYFAKDADHGQIIDFLVECGLPADKIDLIQFGRNSTISIRGLDNLLCLQLIENIHGKSMFSRKVYCNGIIQITPEKEHKETGGADSGNLSIPPQAVPIRPADNMIVIENTHDLSVDKPVVSADGHHLPNLLSPLGSPGWPRFETEELVRRHSLSLLNRTPPKDSLAADLLGGNNSRLQHVNSLLSSIKDKVESLSDFNSCFSSQSSGDESESQSSKADAWIEPKKRKRKKSPGEKEDSLKRVNLKASPVLKSKN